MLPKTAKDTKDSQSRLDFFLMNFIRHNLDRKLGHSSRDLKYILSDVDHTCNLQLRYIRKTRCFKDLGDDVLSKVHV